MSDSGYRCCAICSWWGSSSLVLGFSDWDKQGRADLDRAVIDSDALESIMGVISRGFYAICGL